jgi:hypothetical protein
MMAVVQVNKNTRVAALPGNNFRRRLNLPPAPACRRS